MKDKDISSLEHTTWRCQYHIVFAPKYRRMEIYGQIKQDIGIILRKLCQQKGVEIIEAQACPDHIHMLVSIPPKMSVSGFMGFLKGKRSLMIYQKWGNMKFKYRNRQFWCRGYYVDMSHIFMDTFINADVMFFTGLYCITLKVRSLIEYHKLLIVVIQ